MFSSHNAAVIAAGDQLFRCKAPAFEVSVLLRLPSGMLSVVVWVPFVPFVVVIAAVRGAVLSGKIARNHDGMSANGRSSGCAVASQA